MTHILMKSVYRCQRTNVFAHLSVKIILKILHLFAEELLRYGHKKQKHFCIYQLIHASNLMKAIIVLKPVY